MKTMKSVLLSFLTLAVLVLGMFLPAIISALQSSGAPDQPRQFALEMIKLDAVEPAEVVDILKLMSGSPWAMAVDAGNVLSEEDAADAALDVLEFMAEHGIAIDPQSYTEHRETPYLVFTDDGEEEIGNVWECYFSDPDGGDIIAINLDDETGKMIAFAHISTRSTQPSAVSGTEAIADDWASMCAEYYGFESDGAGTSIWKDGSQNYDFTFISSDGERLVLPFYIRYITDTVITDNANVPETGTFRTIVAFNNSIYNMS